MVGVACYLAFATSVRITWPLGRTGIDSTVRLILAALTAQAMTVGLAQRLSVPGHLSLPWTSPGKHR
jgi:small neutral amino acid transporter SnatA (MarC family)